MSSAVPIRYRFVHLLLLTAGIIHTVNTADDNLRAETLVRAKRQSGAFTRTYSFTPSSCRAGTIAGTVSAAGATYYTVLTPNSRWGITSGGGQIFLADYLTPNVPYTYSVRAWTNQAAFANGAGTNPLGTTTVTVTCLTASGTPSGSTTGGGTTTGPPVAAQSSYTFTSSNCIQGATVGTVSASSASGVLFGAFTSGTPFLVSNTGTITLLRAFTGTQSITVTATNPYGTTQIPVTITCSASSSGGTGGTFPQFGAPLYSFTASPCTAGSIVGTVVASPVGAQYTLASAAPVTVNPTTGQITLTSVPTSSPLNFAVTASNGFGTTATTVSLTCSGSGGTTTVSRMYFTVPVYTFYPTGTACNAGGQLGQVGVIGAIAPVTYTITSTNPGYTISTTGLISNPSTGPVAGTYTVLATDSSGRTATASFVVSRLFCTTTGGGTTTGTCPAFVQTPYTFNPGSSGCGFFSNIGIVQATCSTGGTVTYSIPFNAVNNFGIDPNSGQIYATVPSTTCQTITVTATVQDGTARTTTTQVAIACNGGTCTPTTGGTTGCTQVGQQGCGDIG